MAPTSSIPRRRGRPSKAAAPTPADSLPADVLANFDKLPDCAFVRLPVVRALFGGCSASTVWRGVKTGSIPKPVPLTERMTAWNVGELRQALESRRAA